MKKKQYENRMGNVLQLRDPLIYIIFLKRETALEKHLTKKQD